MRRDHWTDDAACKGYPLLVFFPTIKTDDRYAMAKAVCAVCQVQQQCLDLVLPLPDQLDRWGVFGGLTPFERYLRRHGNACLNDPVRWRKHVERTEPDDD